MQQLAVYSNICSDAMQPTFPASKPLSRVFMQAIDAPLPDDAPEPTAMPAPDAIAPQEAAGE